jgi:ubiquinone/menaquinone biosynthesis C-methylase UbiE
MGISWLISSALALACQSTAAPAGAPPATVHEHGSQHGMHKDFSDAQALSKAFDDPARDAWQRPAEVIEHLRLEPGSVVADLGAGTGYFVSWLSRAVGEQGKVLALDVEPKMIEFLGQRAQQQGLANVTPRLVPTDDPQLEPGSVSRVLIVNTWHHIDDRVRYAAKLASALAAGGEIWIVDFTLDSDVGPPARYRLSPEQVVSELQGGGLRAEVVPGEQLPKQYMVRAVRPPAVR